MKGFAAQRTVQGATVHAVHLADSESPISRPTTRALTVPRLRLRGHTGPLRGDSTAFAIDSCNHRRGAPAPVLVPGDLA